MNQPNLLLEVVIASEASFSADPPGRKAISTFRRENCFRPFRCSQWQIGEGF